MNILTTISVALMIVKNHLTIFLKKEDFFSETENTCHIDEKTYRTK